MMYNTYVLGKCALECRGETVPVQKKTISVKSGAFCYPESYLQISGK